MHSHYLASRLGKVMIHIIHSQMELYELHKTTVQLDDGSFRCGTTKGTFDLFPKLLQSAAQTYDSKLSLQGKDVARKRSVYSHSVHDNEYDDDYQHNDMTYDIDTPIEAFQAQQRRIPYGGRNNTNRSGTNNGRPRLRIRKSLLSSEARTIRSTARGAPANILGPWADTYPGRDGGPDGRIGLFPVGHLLGRPCHGRFVHFH